MFTILTLNMGGTSTKVSIYQDENQTIETIVRNTDEEMKAAPTTGEQVELRSKQIHAALEEAGVVLNDVDAAVIRVRVPRKCTEGGTYELTPALLDEMCNDFDPKETFMHGLGIVVPLLRKLIGDKQIPVYMVDPAGVDEFSDIARISGHPLLPRESKFHALNHKAVAHSVAKEIGIPYTEANLVVAHLGGGVSIGAHQMGRVVDCSNPGMGMNGPFSSNRSGELPSAPLMELCFSGKYTHDEVHDMLFSKGGFVAYTGTGDVREIEKMIAEGDQNAKLILDAFIYQVSKEIAAMCAVLGFMNVDGIVLTGGIAYSNYVVESIKARIGGLVSIYVVPGEEESAAMISGVLRVLRGEEAAHII